MLVFRLGILTKRIYGKELEVHVMFDGGEDFVDGAGGVDSGDIVVLGDLEVGFVEFLLERVALGFPDFLLTVPVFVSLSAEALLLFFFVNGE